MNWKSWRGQWESTPLFLPKNSWHSTDKEKVICRKRNGCLCPEGTRHLKKKTKKPGVTFMCNKMARIFFLSLYKRASHCTSNKKKSSVTIGKYSMVSLVLGAMMVFMKHIYFCFLKSMLYLELVWLLWEREREKERKQEREKWTENHRQAMSGYSNYNAFFTYTNRHRERETG